MICACDERRRNPKTQSKLKVKHAMQWKKRRKGDVKQESKGEQVSFLVKNNQERDSERRTRTGQKRWRGREEGRHEKIKIK